MGQCENQIICSAVTVLVRNSPGRTRRRRDSVSEGEAGTFLTAIHPTEATANSTAAASGGAVRRCNHRSLKKLFFSLPPRPTPEISEVLNWVPCSVGTREEKLTPVCKVGACSRFHPHPPRQTHARAPIRSVGRCLEFYIRF